MRQHSTSLITGALATLAVGACLLPTAAAQDSVSLMSGVAGSDAVSPFDAAEALNNYVVDLTPFNTSWGTEFGIAPLIKTSQPETVSFFGSLPSAQAISATSVSGPFSGDTYGVWNAQGFGVNNNANLNNVPNTVMPQGAARKFSAALAEFSNTYEGVLTGIVEYDPSDPSRLYVKRVASAVNGTFDGDNCSNLAIGSVDAAGNTYIRSDDFGTGPCSGTLLVGNNIFRVRAAARGATVNLIDNGGGDASTDHLIVNSGSTYNTPSCIPSDLSTRPVFIGSNFNSEYVYESAALVTSTDLTHLGVAPDHRGNVHFSKTDYFGGNSVGTAALLGMDNAANFENRRILLWGVDANGLVTGTRSDLLVQAGDTITDNDDGHVFGNNATYPATPDIGEFVHNNSQTAFQGGNGQAAVGQDQTGMVLVATTAPAVASGGSFAANDNINAVLVAKINPNQPANPPVWTTAGYTGSAAQGVLGKPIKDASGGTVIGRMVTLDQVTGGTPNGPSISSPMIDSVGNVWFVAAVEIFGAMQSDFDAALLRAVYHPATFSYELECVMQVGDVFTGQNSATDYQIRFINIADSNSVSSSTAYSGNILQCALNDGPTGALATEAPQTLGGLVIAAEIVYDVNNDGQFIKVTGAGGDPQSVDQEYEALLYIGALEAFGPMEFCNGTDGSLASCPCAPGNADSGCDTPIPAMQGGGTTGGIRLDVVAQVITPNNRATVLGTGFPAGSSPGVTVIRAPSQDAGSPIVFGDGLRCISVPLVRLNSTIASGGSATITFGHGGMAGVGTFYYQMWFRSTPISYCDPTAAFNLSNGQTLDW